MLINKIKLFLLLASFHIIDAALNNACRSFPSYLNWYANNNCFHNPDMSLEPADLIKKYVGKSETHTVTTEDGYILTLFRMPQETPKGVVLLHHPLASDCRVWIGQGNDSLAFYLHQAGYDVWIANNRGTQYSKKHISLSDTHFKYWKFSFHEIGLYDIPSEIKMIRQKTDNSKIIYIGHSQGCSAGMVYSSLKSEEAMDSIKLFIFMATPCYCTHGRSLVKAAEPFEKIIKIANDLLRIGRAVPPGIHPLSKIVFRLFPGALYFVNLFFYPMFGWTPKGSDPIILNLDSGIYLENFSWQLFLHYVQLSIAKERFQYYDHGKHKNLKLYNSAKPPLYPLENMKVPIYFISSYNDVLTSLQDTDLLIQKIQNTTKVRGHLKVSGLDHMGFHFGLDRKRIYIDKLLEFLSTV